MKNALLLGLMTLVSFIRCNDDSPSRKVNQAEAGTVVDIDGNVYQTVEIGDQVWMAENLRVTKYPDGTPIPNVTAASAWMDLKKNNTDGAYCYYNNDANREGDTYGVLYTYAAAIAEDGAHENRPGQGVAPDGWHLPTQAELQELEDYLSANGFEGNLATALKAKSGWGGNSNGTDDFGFSALPSGSRSYVDGGFDDLGSAFNIWSATQVTEGSPCLLEGAPENLGERVCGRHLPSQVTTWYLYDFTKSGGLAIRCVKD